MNLFAILFIFFMTTAPSNIKKATLEVTIGNVKNDKGFILVSLFNEEDGFPGQSDSAFKNEKIAADLTENKIVFENIPLGTYAIAVFHDENDNGQLDKNLLGIPTEGYGSSNNQKKLFRAPNFDECKFKVEEAAISIDIRLNYP